MAQVWTGLLILSACAVAVAMPQSTPHQRSVCGVAPWTSTCSCMPRVGDYPMSFADYATLVTGKPEAEPLLAEARAACRIASGQPATRDRTDSRSSSISRNLSLPK